VFAKGETMRTISWLFVVIASAVLALASLSLAVAGDYNHRFVRNYPPGNHGMWYKAERFYEIQYPGVTPTETYRWDKFMSKVTEVRFPFYPIPYDWEYGNGRTFNLRNDNTNDWLR